MMDIRTARINTAGAYIDLDGLYPFAIGIQPHNGHIPVVRLGGHREENETGWKCGVREVHEETGLQIESLPPPATWLAEWDHIDGELQEIQWQHETEQKPAPFLVVTYQHVEKTSLSLMYLARAVGIPRPSSEVKGLLLLTKDEIHKLCREQITLEDYVSQGGRAILNGEFNVKLVLEPFVQLHLLSKILDIE